MTFSKQPVTQIYHVKKRTKNYKPLLFHLFQKSSNKTSRPLNRLFSIGIWRAICCQTSSSLDNTVNYTDFKVSIGGREGLVVRKECMFHVFICGCQLSMEEKRRERMHDRLKIASVGSAIFSRSGNEGLHVALKDGWSLR